MENQIAKHFDTEEQMQAYCFQWFDGQFPWQRKMLFHVNNNQSKSASHFIRMKDGNLAKAKGVVPGVLDFVFVGALAVTFIELKMPDGILSEDQKEFIRKAEERGHKCHVCYSFEKFRLLIIELVKQSEELLWQMKH